MPNFIANKKQRNQTMTGSNTHHGLLASGQAKATWAKYLSKWVTAYEAQLDTKLWGVTVQVGTRREVKRAIQILLQE